MLRFPYFLQSPQYQYYFAIENLAVLHIAMQVLPYLSACNHAMVALVSLGSVDGGGLGVGVGVPILGGGGCGASRT